MTRQRKKWWAKSYWTSIPLYLPMVAVHIAHEVTRGTRAVARSARKGKKKQKARAQRRKANKQAATRDIALQTPTPKVTERNRLQSHFLQLPLELRQQIYEDYFEPATLKLREYGIHGYKLTYTEQYSRDHWIGFLHNPRLRDSVPPRDLLVLPLVCRQTYVETIYYLYERHTFKIPSHLALEMLRLELFPRRYLDSLRSIELKFCFDELANCFKTSKLEPAPYCEKAIRPWMTHVPGRYKRRREWLAGWKLLAELPLLERLRVEFTWLPGPVELGAGEVEWIMAPLLRFKRPKPLLQFDVFTSSISAPVSPGWAKAIPYQLKSP